MKASAEVLWRKGNDLAAPKDCASPLAARSAASSHAPTNFRADITGLRAIAVVSVVLFHISAKLVPGGFTGVDIFFVISGYLITKIIAQEMELGQFSFADFYLRRVRRILPAFWVVLSVTAAVGYVILLPQDVLYALRSARAAATFTTNIFFAARQGYFAPTAEEQPFLHMWSLAVEEQFYVVWPLVLFASFYFGSKLTYRNRRAFLVGLIAIAIILSFSVSEHLLGAKSGQAYYSTLSRAGELLIGALVAVARFIDRPRVNQWIGALGLAGIVACLFGISGDLQYPGWLALLPTASAALILYSGQGRDDSVSAVARMLGNRYVGYVGMVSYSLYLWHWPILAYMHYVYGWTELPATWDAVAVAASLTLSVLTYRLVEVPAKRIDAGFWKVFAGYYAAPFVLLLAVSVPTSKFLGTEKADANPIFHSLGVDICHDTMKGRCTRGMTSVAPRYLLVGDSHAGMLNSFMDAMGKHEGWAADVLSASSCSPVFGFDTRILKVPAQPCEDLKNYLKDNFDKYDAVLIESYWALQLNMVPSRDHLDPEYLQKLDKTLREIARTRPVYVLSDIQPAPYAYPQRLDRFRQLGLQFKRAQILETQEANAIIRRLVESIPGVHWIDLTPEANVLSADGSYMGLPVYLNGDHLDSYGASALASLMIARGQRLLPPEPSTASTVAQK